MKQAYHIEDAVTHLRAAMNSLAMAHLDPETDFYHSKARGDILVQAQARIAKVIQVVKHNFDPFDKI